MYKAAVALIFFNRPEKTEQVLRRVLEWNPRVIVLISDGPREHIPDEILRVHELRCRVEQMAVGVPVHKIYADKNMGCAWRVSTGITETLKKYGEAIFIEDDCLPSLEFFDFASAMLNKYRYDDRIFSVSGTFLGRKWDRIYRYGFTPYPLIWGWATWLRAWDGYDLMLNNMQSSDISGLEGEDMSSGEVADWIKMLAFVKSNPYFTWDYQFLLHVIAHRGLSIHPYSNLVCNIGYGDGATHTKAIGRFSDLPLVELGQGDLSPSVDIDEEYRRFVRDEYFHPKVSVGGVLFRIRFHIYRLINFDIRNLIKQWP